MSGVIPPMITPFAEDDTIGRALLRTETEYMLEAGVSGLVVAGSTGEGAGMSADEIYEAVAIVTETVSGRVPVLCGIIADTTEEAVRLGIAARKAGPWVYRFPRRIFTWAYPRPCSRVTIAALRTEQDFR